MGFLAWVRQIFHRTPTIEDIDIIAPTPVTEIKRPKVTPPPPPARSFPPDDAAVRPVERTSTPASVTPGGVTSSAQIAAMLDRAVYRGALVDKLVNALKTETAEAKAPGDKLFVSFLLRAVTNEGIDLPALPDVVVKIQRILSRPECNVHELEQAISCEPMVTTKVIGVANSAIYRGRKPVRGLHDALVRVGQRETRNIVMAILSKTKLFRVPGFEDKAIALYRNALASSLTMQILAKPLALDGDEAFITGLVHNLGELVLLNAASEVHRSSRGQSRVSEDTMKRLSEAIHPALSALVAETWDFDPRVISAVENHHQPELAADPAKVLADALFLADEIAQRVVAGGDSEAILGPQPAFEVLGIDQPEVVTEQARLSFEAFEAAMRDDPIRSASRTASMLRAAPR